MDENSESDREAKLHRRLVRYSFITGIILSAALGIYLIQQDATLSWNEQMSSLGISLVASATFAVIFSLLVDRERDDLISHRIRESFRSHFDELFTELRRTNSLYVPHTRYPPTESFDPNFNHDLMKSIQSSSTYYFQGVTAKYVPGRLKKAQNCPSSVIAIVSHPNSGAARQRVSDRIKNPKYAGKTADQIATEMQDETLETLVGLFDCRHLASIEVVFSDDTAVTRTELTDSTAYVTWYHGADSRGQAFPETLCFELASFYYQIARLRILRTVELYRAKSSIKFDYTTTEEVARSKLAMVFDRRVSDISFRRLRSDFQSRMESFDSFLNHLGEAR